MQDIVKLVKQHYSVSADQVSLQWIASMKMFGVSVNRSDGILFVGCGKTHKEIRKALEKKFGRKKH